MAADCPVTLFRRDPVESGWVVAEVGAEPHADDIIRTAVAESVLRDLSLRLLLDTPRDTDQVGISRADLRSRVEIVLDRWRRVHAGLDCRVVPEIWSRDDFLMHHKTRIALFIAPPCHDHDIGTILHPAADAALDILDGPVMLYVEPGSTRRSAAAGGDVRPRGARCPARQPTAILLSPHASAMNSFSSSASVIGCSPLAVSPVRHSRIPVATILKPARSKARDTAASWVTTSLHSRPCSIIAMTPASWPCARRNLLRTAAIASSSPTIGLFLAFCR